MRRVLLVNLLRIKAVVVRSVTNKGSILVCIRIEIIIVVVQIQENYLFPVDVIGLFIDKDFYFVVPDTFNSIMVVVQVVLLVLDSVPKTEVQDIFSTVLHFQNFTKAVNCPIVVLIIIYLIVVLLLQTLGL